MDLEIFDDNNAPIEIFSEIPTEMQKHVITGANPIFAKGSHFLIMMQELQGDGFAAWYSKYLMKTPKVLRAQSNQAMLELRISLKNRISGTWENISNPALANAHFQMSYVPYVKTKAIFESKGEYETFDIHFDLTFLQSIGLDYKTLDLFLNSASKNSPSELSVRNQPCSPFMLECIDNILHNFYSAKGKGYILSNNISNILIAALEIVGREEIGKLQLSDHDIDALYNIKEQIDYDFPVYPNSKEMVRKAAISLFKLHIGFRKLFGTNPYDYFREKRLTTAKQMLRQDHKIEAIRQALNYGSSEAFVREFKKRFGYTPSMYKKYGD